MLVYGAWLRRGRTFLLAFTVLMLLVASGCQTVTLNDVSSGDTVVLSRGEGLDVPLDDDPADGYVWVLEPPDESVIRQRGAADPSGDTVTWHFASLSVGQTVLRLVYVPEDDINAEPIREFEVMVRVE